MSITTETRHEKFKRLVRIRIGRISDDLELIKNLSITKNYEYSKAEVDDYFSVLYKGVDIVTNGIVNYTKTGRITIDKLKIVDKQETESKNQKFNRVMVSRINRILENMELLINTGNKSHYTFKKEDIDNIEIFLLESISIARANFQLISIDNLKLWMNKFLDI